MEKQDTYRWVKMDGQWQIAKVWNHQDPLTQEQSKRLPITYEIFGRNKLRLEFWGVDDFEELGPIIEKHVE